MSVSFSDGVNRSIVCARISRSCCAIAMYIHQNVLVARRTSCTVPSFTKLLPSIPQSPRRQRGQILSQAGSFDLAPANAASQSVRSLLQR